MLCCLPSYEVTWVKKNVSCQIKLCAPNVYVCHPTFGMNWDNNPIHAKLSPYCEVSQQNWHPWLIILNSECRCKDRDTQTSCHITLLVTVWYLTARWDLIKESTNIQMEVRWHSSQENHPMTMSSLCLKQWNDSGRVSV